ncbi:hypothetical protein QWY77_02615 [Thalassotalea ponticola]|uniref:hypothetical protein n=1 Tax=Thalassotalea ponticola TaxID=1523392 RepID=UPI0025B3522F|nr:hypothetical protein [Thalassotalea ponticola]MDN3651657.1 hypothetical protein [Thalassotalea ponticola]
MIDVFRYISDQIVPGKTTRHHAILIAIAQPRVRLVVSRVSQILALVTCLYRDSVELRLSSTIALNRLYPSNIDNHLSNPHPFSIVFYIAMLSRLTLSFDNRQQTVSTINGNDRLLTKFATIEALSSLQPVIRRYPI